MDYSTASASVAIGLIGIITAWILYKKLTLIPDRISVSLGGIYKTIYNKFYIDEVYLFVTKKIIFNCISQPVAWFDRHIVDGSMNGIGWLTMCCSRSIRNLQSGRLQQYAFVFISGVIGLVLFIIYWTQR
jgi:NADH-quinone oxidoreductase subunit L